MKQPYFITPLILLLLLASSCDNKDVALQRLSDLTTNLCDSSDFFSDEKWIQAKEEYDKLTSEIGGYEVSFDQYEEISREKEICQCKFNQHDMKRAVERKIVYSNSNKGFINIYEQPDINSRTIGMLTNDSWDYDGVDTSLQWYRVKQNNREGYVQKSEAIVFCGNPFETKTVYYVVIGGWYYLNTAIKDCEQYPEDYKRPIFAAINFKDEHVYRICYYSTYDKEEANIIAEQIRACGIDIEGLKSAYVWKNIGQAKCVYQPIGFDDEPVVVSPK